MLPSGSLRLAVTGTPTRICVLDRVTTPSSFSFMTVTFTAISPRLPSLSAARTVTSYTLSVLASVGASKSGLALNVSAPASMENLLPSSPATDHVGGGASLSGSVPV